MRPPDSKLFVALTMDIVYTISRIMRNVWSRVVPFWGSALGRSEQCRIQDHAIYCAEVR
jgi:hypothetical protein